MESSSRVFADSNFFIALFNSSDSLYTKAVSAAQILDGQATTLVISNFIFLEVTTVLSQKRGKKVALAAGNYLLSEPRIQVLHVDEHRQLRAWNMFQRVPAKNTSFVDCSNIVLMQDEGIGTLLTFDQIDAKILQKFYRFRIFKTSS